MTAKQFFKGTAFKCIMVLLVIVLISGIFLTFCNALFYVSDEERLQRAISKIYGEEVESTELEIDDTITIDDAELNAVYQITTEKYSGDYLLNVTGKDGYGTGTVTCYVVVNITDSVLSVGKVSISTNTNQSFISKISSSALDSFEAVYGTALSSTGEYYVLYNETDGFYTEPADSITNHLATGATKSMRAICNAVNGAVDYMNAKYLGIVVTTIYDEFDYTDKINKDNTTHEVNGDVVTYSIVTKSFGDAGSFTIEITVDATQKVTAYSITTDGSTYGFSQYMYTGSYVGLGVDDLLALIDVDSSTVVDGGSLDTGASYSNYLCAYAALFATANYQNCLDLEVSE